MTGLDLEMFLQLIRADLGAWASLGVVVLILSVMTWTSWGSRRALRKCLALSIAAHVGLIAYGGSSPVVLRILRLGTVERKPPAPVERVRVTPLVEPIKKANEPDGRPARNISAWDQDRGPLALAEPTRIVAPPTPTPSTAPSPSRTEPSPIVPEAVAPEVAAPALPAVEPAPPVASKPAEPPPSVAPADASEVAPRPAEVAAPAAREPSVVPGVADLRARSRPTGPSAPMPSPRSGEPSPSDALPPASLTPSPVLETPIPGPARFPSTSKPSDDAPVAAQADLEPMPSVPIVPAAAPSPGDSLPGAEVRRAPRPSPPSVGGVVVPAPRRLADDSSPMAMARVTPTGPSTLPTSPRPVGRRAALGGSRRSIDRGSIRGPDLPGPARGGASVASEQAV